MFKRLYLLGYMGLLSACTTAPHATTTSRHTEVTGVASHIAVLLPLSGNYASYGKQVQEGFLSAHFADLTHNNTGETFDQANLPGTQITFFDTASMPADKAYEAALKGGADRVVGPLLKDEVQEMLSSPSHLTVPTLLLNNVQKEVYSTGTYQFSLSAEDEADSLAIHAFHAGRRHPLILVAQKTEVNHRIKAAFTKRWETLGAEIMDTSNRPPNASLAQWIKATLQVQENKNSFSYRQDIDFVVLISDADNARQIMPLFAFYNIRPLPVYSTSQVIGVHANPTSVRDLDRLTICDMPWSIEKTHKTPTQARFFALGLDAYALIPYLTHPPATPLQGHTGLLTFDKGVIHRSVPCILFEHGKPRR